MCFFPSLRRSIIKYAIVLLIKEKSLILLILYHVSENFCVFLQTSKNAKKGDSVLCGKSWKRMLKVGFSRPNYSKEDYAMRCAATKRTIGLHHLGKLERKHMEQGQGIIPTVLSDYYVSYSSNSFLPEPQVNWDVR